ncbi:Serine/threonine-protein kinase AFC2 [Platanthera guangdongensis]|uniref:Serine/threonine-protein kinase AFC2 n=1 Tax=Platanthera guangdongensis TaxID=2320717 RepID=A0ABR2LJ01_9ASPA
MGDSVNVVLEFLRKNRFSKAEAALRGEISCRPDLNGFLQKNYSEDEDLRAESKSATVKHHEVSQEFIVKEIEVGNGTMSKNGIQKNQGHQVTGVSMGDLYPWDSFDIGGNANWVSKGNAGLTNNFSNLLISEENRCGHGSKNSSIGTKLDLMGKQSISYSGRAVEIKPGNNQSNVSKASCSYPKDHLLENPWSTYEESSNECSVKTVLPFSCDNQHSSYDSFHGDVVNSKDRKKKPNHHDSAEGLKEQPYSLEMSQVINNHSLDIPPAGDNHREELPRLPPVRLKSEDKLTNFNWEEKINHLGSGGMHGRVMHHSGDSNLMIGSFLDVPIGQEISASGGKRTSGGSWLSVSQGIAEDASDLVSGFATLGDDSIDYPNEYWDSDEYEDDDDVGYMRQPIEDETWFLAHEIDYPSDNEKGTGHGSVPDQQDPVLRKDEDDDQSFAEEDSYLSGEQYFLRKNVEPVSAPERPMGLVLPETYRKSGDNNLITHYDGQLLDVEELNLMNTEPVWQGFVNQGNELIMLENGKAFNERERSRPGDLLIDEEHHSSVRSIGVGINSDTADIGSEVRESLVGGSSEGDLEYFHDLDTGISGSGHSKYGASSSYFIQSKKDETKKSKQDFNKYVYTSVKVNSKEAQFADVGFSFPSPLHKGDNLGANSGKTLWSSKGDAAVGDASDEYGKGIGSEDMLTTWRRKSNDSSPVRSSRDEKYSDTIRSRNSSVSSALNHGYDRGEGFRNVGEANTKIDKDEEPGIALEDEESAALQEQVRQIKSQEEEFETFNLKIVHRKNRTGFEEDKNFNVVLNSVIAGRYHVTEYLGSAAFSKAIQAHDLHTGIDVCVKIIKNNKDFFDQSLDEIKLLKFVNKHDPADKYHILRLYDYFYYREHLLIVCELLKANLYEFHKFNRESGGEVYFTMPRLQSITIQCLEALQFLHGLGLIHCDLKPENILVKSYSRCEVKVIDLGSSCFETDHLCSYVQSRSYRAPEVILGLPYDKKIDIWSLGCILAELCTGNVLFQNDSPATLLARVIGIIGSLDQTMLAKARDTYKYFTKNHMLYERNQETNRLEYLIPKKTSLRHRLPMGDQGFIDFIAHLLEINPKKRPSAEEALRHPWLSYPYEPISS